VVGTIDVLPGGPSQGRNDYLMARLGSAIPAFRGVLSLVARKILFAANNPYIKPWAVRVRRFTAGWHDAPWMEWNAEVRTWDDDEGQEISVGMNPAHILVQCLTDPHWGMGYPPDCIGWSFWNAAWAVGRGLWPEPDLDAPAAHRELHRAGHRPHRRHPLHRPRAGHVSS
jgi:hypothetical protein